MAKVYCNEKHEETDSAPAMINFNSNGLGQEYICAKCAAVRVFNTGKIVMLDDSKQWGFITGPKDNIYFKTSSLVSPFTPAKGMFLSYEVAFFNNNDGDNKKNYQAINIEQLNQAK